LAAAGENAHEGRYVGVVAAPGEGDVIGARGGEQVGGGISASTAGLAKRDKGSPDARHSFCGFRLLPPP